MGQAASLIRSRRLMPLRYLHRYAGLRVKALRDAASPTAKKHVVGRNNACGNRHSDRMVSARIVYDILSWRRSRVLTRPFQR